MKTAMQELLQILESKILPCDDDNSYVYGMNVAHANLIYNIKNGFLEKEKEQIITDYSNGLLYALGYKHQDKNIDYGVTMQSKAEADIYYNQTYLEKEVGIICHTNT